MDRPIRDSFCSLLCTTGLQLEPRSCIIKFAINTRSSYVFPSRNRTACLWCRLQFPWFHTMCCCAVRLKWHCCCDIRFRLNWHRTKPCWVLTALEPVCAVFPSTAVVVPLRQLEAYDIPTYAYIHSCLTHQHRGQRQINQLHLRMYWVRFSLKKVSVKNADTRGNPRQRSSVQTTTSDAAKFCFVWFLNMLCLANPSLSKQNKSRFETLRVHRIGSTTTADTRFPLF